MYFQFLLLQMKAKTTSAFCWPITRKHDDSIIMWLLGSSKIPQGIICINVFYNTSFWPFFLRISVSKLSFLQIPHFFPILPSSYAQVGETSQLLLLYCHSLLVHCWMYFSAFHSQKESDRVLRKKRSKTQYCNMHFSTLTIILVPQTGPFQFANIFSGPITMPHWHF